MVRAIPRDWPGLFEKCRPIFLCYSHGPLFGQFGIMKAPMASRIFRYFFFE